MENSFVCFLAKKKIDNKSLKSSLAAPSNIAKSFSKYNIYFALMRGAIIPGGS